MTMPSLPDIENLLLNVNLREPTWDLFIVAFYALGVLLYGFSMGKYRLVVNMIAIYCAMAVAKTVPDLAEIGGGFEPQHTFTAQAVVFVFAFVGLYYLLSKRSPLSRVVNSYRKEKWSHVALYSLVHVGLILATILSFVPSDSVIPLSPAVKTIFTHSVAQFIWVISPIILMIILPERRRGTDF